MQIIPAINCENFECVENKLQKAAVFSEWVHIDIADGKFTPRVLWNNPQELIANCKLQIAKLNIEVHAMVENPEKTVEQWIPVGVKRIIIHLEALPDRTSFDRVHELCKNAGVELGLAIKPDTPAEQLKPFLSTISFVQTLGVNPGWAGQSVQKHIFDKIKEIKANHPDLIIEMDGGVNLEVAKQAKEAGADIAVSASFLWGSENSKNMYQQLTAL